MMTRDPFLLRPMRQDEWAKVAAIVCASIREWYERAGRPGRFPEGPTACMLFPEVYEELDPGRCIVAEDLATGRLAGSCFYHPRPTHVSLGIMNAHPDYFGRGAAKQMLDSICDFADREGKPVRLVSSAMNIDSFSLYTRAGFVPRDVYQIMSITVPRVGIGFEADKIGRVRPATSADIVRMTELEFEVSGIRRAEDLRYFVSNQRGIWKTAVIESAAGGIDGFLVSICHPGSTMIGPGVMRRESDAVALMAWQLEALRGSAPACLVPVKWSAMVSRFYRWGLRNSELAIFQSRGIAQPFNGVSIPSFMPETG